MAAQVATQIPWKELIKIIPTVVVAAKELWNKWSSKTQPPLVDPQSEMKIQIATIVGRLQALESSEVDQANLMKQITEQLQGISTGLTEVSDRSSIGVWLGASALVVSCITLLLVVLR